MKIKKMITLLGLVSFLLLSGCVNVYRQKDPKAHHYKSPAIRQMQLAKVRTWRADGAFSIKHRAGQRSEIANFTWDEVNQKNYRINIFSILNLYQLQIYHEYHLVKIWKNGSFLCQARTPERLMEKAVGWSLPLREAAYWIKDMPAKNGGHYVVHYDRYGHIATLQQKGWLITYSDYRTNVNGIDIARRIKMQRPGLWVKIAITRFYWIMEPYKYPQVKG